MLENEPGFGLTPEPDGGHAPDPTLPATEAELPAEEGTDLLEADADAPDADAPSSGAPDAGTPDAAVPAVAAPEPATTAAAVAKAPVPAIVPENPAPARSGWVSVLTPAEPPPSPVAPAVAVELPAGAGTAAAATVSADPAPTTARRSRRRPATAAEPLFDPGAAVRVTGTTADAAGAAIDLPTTADVAEAPARRRRRATSPSAAEATAASAEAEIAPATTEPESGPVEAAVEAAPRSRRGRRRTADAPVVEADDAAAPPAANTQPAAASVAGQPVAGSAETGQPAEPEEPTRGRSRRRVPPVVLFMAPDPNTPTAALPADEQPDDEAQDDTEAAGSRTARRRRGRRTPEPVETAVEDDTADDLVDDAEAAEEDDEDDDELGAAARRRRRRGRRGRGRGRGEGGYDDEDGESAEDGEAEPAAAEADADTDDSEDDDEPGGSLARRRRRRRRKGAGDVETSPDDPANTVVRIREPRAVRDEVQGVSGSTRLEAKRQRRRDGREQRRTRPPILTESEFLARREAVDRVMAVRLRGDRTQIAVLEDGIVVEHYVTRATTHSMVGNVYLGRVQNVLPSMEAAFVDVGRGRNAVLYAGEVNWEASGLEGRTRTIEQALKSGDSVLVQVTKDPIGSKGARLTSHIALSGRHLVYTPFGNASGISRKLSDIERKRLRDTLKGLIPDGAGVIVRTAAEGASEDDLARDVKRLQAQWGDIEVKAGQGGAPVLLYEEPDLVIRVVRDVFNEDFRELVVQGGTGYEMVESYLSHVAPDLVDRVHRHTGAGDVFADLRVDEQLMKALDRKVYLPSGGSLVIDRTEAMTVVDVNTGKYTGAGGNLEETVTRNNIEAAEEIVRQLRLRDIGGIIVIDFIDMVLESNRELVLRRLTECLGRDRTKHQVTEITSLGLVQMTRKRVGHGLLEAFSETCEACKGRGLIIHTEPVGQVRPSTVTPAKAVAAATGTEVAEGSRSSRRRGRRGAAEPAETGVDAEVDAVSDVVVDVVESDDGDGDGDGDIDDAGGGELAVTAGRFDPDSVDDGDAEPTGRRRGRRGGSTRRRTRP